MLFKRVLLAFLIACFCQSCADPEELIHLDIKANNSTFTFHVPVLGDTITPYKITIGGSELNNTDFEHTYQYDAHNTKVTIDLGIIRYGHKVNYCVYFQEHEIPSCNNFSVKPLPIR